ncbi:hypothetical protein C8J57DRAFT_1243703 [Mycena rebaudengoi]|nr:hypothetical protein C8J57DRAFT_1243703 [Mycena rebaudengoi]
MCRVVVQNRGKECAGISDKKINERLDVVFGIWSPILGVGVYFLTDAPEPGGIKLDEVVELEFPVEVEEPCKDLLVSWMWGKKWVSREEELIAEGVAALMALQMGSPLRARLNGSTVE